MTRRAETRPSSPIPDAAVLSGARRTKPLPAPPVFLYNIRLLTSCVKWSNATSEAEMRKKTEGVRLPVDLLEDVRATAPALGETAPGYIARVVREALDRDMAEAAKRLAERAKKKR